MDPTTTVARLPCDEQTARRLAAFLGESLDTENVVCAAFVGDDGRWHVAIHFRGAPHEAQLRALVKVAAGEVAAHSLTIEPLAAADWVTQSLADLKPIRVGRFLIHGAHDRARLKANDTGVEIEAALAFGTGHHGTTRGCLTALNLLTKQRRLRRVLDIGTGSGILAITSAKVLRTRIVASDIDRRAVDVAHLNSRLNRVASLVVFAHAAGTDARAIVAGAPYQLVFANILLSPLTRLAVPLRKLVAPGGRIVLSGLLPSHANAALSVYRAQGLALERRITLDNWVTLVMRRNRGRSRRG
jgi:ribosomal protein L11 methyltransferase